MEWNVANAHKYMKSVERATSNEEPANQQNARPAGLRRRWCGDTTYGLRQQRADCLFNRSVRCTFYFRLLQVFIIYFSLSCFFFGIYLISFCSCLSTDDGFLIWLLAYKG